VPDRDYISRHIGAPWRSAARLWVSDGPADLTIDKARAALAKALRDVGVPVERARLEAGRVGAHLDPEARERLVERLLIERALFAPTRDERLRAIDVARLGSEEQQMLDALAPDVRRYAAAVLEGRRPTVRRRPRPDVRQVLETAVPIQLS
jgi:uncharacterized protein with von Willebrand factor type A (vWA) domain